MYKNLKGDWSMSENKKKSNDVSVKKSVSDDSVKINDGSGDNGGFIQIADDVVSSIAGLAIMEVEGVARLTGNITKDLITKLGKKNLAKGIRIDFGENGLTIDTSIEVKFGYNIVDVCKDVQEKVKTNISSMTGLSVKKVNVRVSSVDIDEKEK
jgi:uncharacterized alkaline shock family protein YloU